MFLRDSFFFFFPLNESSQRNKGDFELSSNAKLLCTVDLGGITTGRDQKDTFFFLLKKKKKKKKRKRKRKRKKEKRKKERERERKRRRKEEENKKQKTKKPSRKNFVHKFLISLSKANKRISTISK